MAKLYTLCAATHLLLSCIYAQGVVRRGSLYPELARRQVVNCTADCAAATSASTTFSSTTSASTTSDSADSCSADCSYCVPAWKLEWRETSPRLGLATITIIEEVQEDGSTKTITQVPSDETIADEYSKYISLIASTQAAHESVIIENELTVTFPTPYLTVQSFYAWAGTLQTIDENGDETCEINSAEPSTLSPDDAPPLSALPVVTTPTPSSSRTDPHGYYFELTSTLTVVPAVYTDEAAIESCKAACADQTFQPLLAVAGSLDGVDDASAVTPQLSVAFVTACRHGVKGAAASAVACTSVKPGVNPPDPGSGGGGNPANPNPDNRVTTTDGSGHTMIVAAPPSNPELRPSTNAQGGVVIVTANDAPDSGPGQITLTNAAGDTIVVQGGTMADASGAHDGNAVTVTNAANELVVIEGGVTGTLQTGAGGQGTVLVAGTVTQTSWMPGATIEGGVRGAGPTAQGGAGRGGGRGGEGWLLVTGMVVMGAIGVVGVML